jgi:PGF-CTERM protein
MLIVGSAVVAGNDDLLGRYEKGDKEFEKVEIGDMIVYWHQRMIDDAIVEGDYIVYQFDRNTHELLKKKEHWRSDLPDHVIPVITKEQAEYMVKGEVQFTQLYIISPESDVFPVDPTPQNPCWVVRSVDNGKMIVTIIDAVEGKILGYGVPPPPGLGGPDWGSWEVTPGVTATPVATPSPSSTPTASPAGRRGIPGFEVIVAIAGLLAIAYLVLKREREM